MQLQEYELIAITETLWDSSHNWNAVMEGYMLFLGKTVQEGEVELLLMSESNWSALSSA